MRLPREGCAFSSLEAVDAVQTIATFAETTVLAGTTRAPVALAVPFTTALTMTIASANTFRVTIRTGSSTGTGRPTLRGLARRHSVVLVVAIVSVVIILIVVVVAARVLRI